MSLTSEVLSAKSQTRMFIDEHVPHLKEVTKRLRSRIRQQNFEPDNTYSRAISYAFAGSAIDYRLRAFFSNDFYRSPAIIEGISWLERTDNGQNPWFNIDAIFRRTSATDHSLAARLFDFLDEFVARERPAGKQLLPDSERTLASISVLCAGIDACCRRSFEALDYVRSLGDKDVQAMLSKLDRAIIDDVSSVFARFFIQNAARFRDAKNVHVGATFSGSEHIGGADCDLILDRTLIDFKASKLPNIRLEYVYQLIGYFLLDYEDEYQIRAFSLCFPRHLFWLDFEVSELFDEPRIPAIRAEFKKLQAQRYEERKLAFAATAAPRHGV
ncbi:hypothetical protein [Rhizobium sp. MHM7A]|uniref:hypothetical protein n=1 Tax=Rhizobium sp. MHM7A TaxID=2583233 RepID=UPI001106D3A1|nr:hypothetical protein [Rhizobium sp. MHM7A]TLX16309.1 hypothetical protein FFR93_02985 [Rhizobium sp. MHM7A]